MVSASAALLTARIQALVEFVQHQVQHEQNVLHGQWSDFVQLRTWVADLNRMQQAGNYVSQAPVRAVTRFQQKENTEDVALELLQSESFPPERATGEGFIVVEQPGMWFNALVSYLKDGQIEKLTPLAQCRKLSVLGNNPANVDAPVWQPCLLVTGGHNSDDGVLARAEMYNPISATWNPMPAMLKKRTQHAAVQYKGRVIVLGGKDGNAFMLRSVEEYTTETGQWKFLPDMNTERAQCCATIFGDKLLAIGGYLDGPIASVEEYNFKTRIWHPMVPMQLPRAGAAVCLVDGRPFVVGGIGPDGVTAKVERYFPNNGTWRPVADMLTRRAYCACVELNGKAIVVGGCDQDYNRLCSVEEYSPLENAWYFLTCMTTKRQGCSAVVWEGRLVVVGGWDGDKELDMVEVYDPFTQTWEQMPSLGTECSGSAIVEVPLPCQPLTQPSSPLAPTEEPMLDVPDDWMEEDLVALEGNQTVIQAWAMASPHRTPHAHQGGGGGLDQRMPYNMEGSPMLPRLMHPRLNSLPDFQRDQRRASEPAPQPAPQPALPASTISRSQSESSTGPDKQQSFMSRFLLRSKQSDGSPRVSDSGSPPPEPIAEPNSAPPSTKPRGVLFGRRQREGSPEEPITPAGLSAEEREALKEVLDNPSGTRSSHTSPTVPSFAPPPSPPGQVTELPPPVYPPVPSFAPPEPALPPVEMKPSNSPMTKAWEEWKSSVLRDPFDLP